MKRIILNVILLFMILGNLVAQDEQEKGFKKQNLFTGGSITASFYTGGTALGANPMFGYKLANWADAGISLNYVYSSYLDYYGNKVSQDVLGPGVFTRLYPFRFFYIEGQYEHNFINQKYIDPSGNKLTAKADANSLLLGGGIAEGRRPGSNTFFYISILFDVLKNPYSPYVNPIYDQNGNFIDAQMIPVFRAGINIGLFQGKQKRYENEEERNNGGHKQPRNYNNL